MAAVSQQAMAAAVEALHASRCREPGCLARSREEQDARTVLEAAAAAAPSAMTQGIAADTLNAFAAELDRLDAGLDPGLGHYEFARAAVIARFRAVQARDGLPDPDTGISHCAACHGADLDPDGPRCGHYAGCPEC
jgi:hypothetical protein